jgi:hypothetical protein
MKYDIFISYRREGGFEVAKHIYDLLKKDGYNVSFDMDTLQNGNFNTELLKRIDECNDFVLILNKGVFDRCFIIDKNNDWLRIELSYALEKGKNIIPVMLEDFVFPENLPADIADVAMKNSPKYDKYYFDNFYQRFRDKFLLTKQPKSKRGLFIGIAVAVLVVAISFTSYRFSQGEQEKIDKQEQSDSTVVNVIDSTEYKNYMQKGDSLRNKGKCETAITMYQKAQSIFFTKESQKKIEECEKKIEPPLPNPEPVNTLLSATNYNGIPNGKAEVQFIKNLPVLLIKNNNDTVETTILKNEFLAGDWDKGRLVGNGELKRNNFSKIKDIKKIIIK